MTKFINMLKDDSGAAAAEYALILAIVGAAIAVAAIGLGSAVANSMNRDRKSTRLNSSHLRLSRMPSSA